MEEADTKLSSSLEKLELEVAKNPNKLYKDDHNVNQNPFRRRSKSLSSIVETSFCDCKKIKKTTIFKRNKKILKEPIMKIVKFQKDGHKKSKEIAKLFGQCSKCPEKKSEDFVACSEQQQRFNLERTTCLINESFKTFRLNKSNKCKKNTEVNSNLSSTSSCSHQARFNLANPPCDVTIDELASYFETSVHIPKKMSSMAEMMYI